VPQFASFAPQELYLQVEDNATIARLASTRPKEREIALIAPKASTRHMPNSRNARNVKGATPVSKKG
jgi:hypothetical protein